MINLQIFELLLAFSVAVWALISKTPVKALVKALAIRLFNSSWPIRKKFFAGLTSGEFEQYTVKFFAALIALFLIGLAKTIDIAVIADNLSSEWQWVRDAEFISAAGVISLIPVKYSLLYYLDLIVTVALISVVGSAGIHRLEKWVGGNGLLFDVLRQWLLTNKQADILEPLVLNENIPSGGSIPASDQPTSEAVEAVQRLGFIADE